MKGPLQVIRRRRSESDANETDTAQAATEAPTTAQPAVEPGPVAATDATSQAPPAAVGPVTAEQAAAGEQSPTTEQPTTSEQPQASDLPAGTEPVPERPSFRHRGRLRRRLRYLRRIRELGFRDLGGLVFDQHKFANINEELVRGKLTALAAVDAELRALEHALDDRRPLTELREPGISVCPRCGALHGSDARYCPSCGVPVRGPRAIAEVGEAVSLSVGQIGAVAAPAEPQRSVQPPAQLRLHTERPAPVAEQPAPVAEQPAPGVEQPDPEPQPAATEVAEREAAKAEAERAPDQPTEVMRQPADGVHGAVARPSGERRES
jgi:ribosomal protein L40E